MEPNSIFDEIAKEREYQIHKWGHKADSEINRPMDFVGYITHHSTRWFNGGFAPYNAGTLLHYRGQMIKVAALALAAIQQIDKIMDGELHRPDILAIV